MVPKGKASSRFNSINSSNQNNVSAVVEKIRASRPLYRHKFNPKVGKTKRVLLAIEDLELVLQLLNDKARENWDWRVSVSNKFMEMVNRLHKQQHAQKKNKISQNRKMSKEKISSSTRFNNIDL